MNSCADERREDKVWLQLLCNTDRRQSNPTAVPCKLVHDPRSNGPLSARMLTEYRPRKGGEKDGEEGGLEVCTHPTHTVPDRCVAVATICVTVPPLPPMTEYVVTVLVGRAWPSHTVLGGGDLTISRLVSSLARSADLETSETSKLQTIKVVGRYLTQW